MHAALLLPLFHSLWLSQGTGNANFYYATTLVFGLGMTATVMDALWAGLRVGFGPRKEGWEMIQINNDVGMIGGGKGRRGGLCGSRSDWGEIGKMR